MTSLFRLAASTTIVFLLTAAPTFALQQLLPTPYPSGLGATAESIPNGAVMHRHQHLLRDAVPRTYGMNAQHNPHRIRYARHQHLIRTPYRASSGRRGYLIVNRDAVIASVAKRSIASKALDCFAFGSQ